MSTAKRRNSLLSRGSPIQTTKDELLHMKYSMERPSHALYALNEESDSPTFPDFNPWRDHHQMAPEAASVEQARLSNATYLNKGYFEAPVVSNEYFSARNLIQATIFSSTDNCNSVLKELSSHLAAGYKVRDEIINKIGFSSHSFKLPPRVTLTASKKEQWLRDLASPSVPLSKVGEKIPHGMRNKVLIDAICSKSVPVNRALWFTRCVLFGELITLRRKHRGDQLDKMESHWLQEWSQQVSDYLYKFSKEAAQVSSPSKKEAYSIKLAYLMQYIQALYIEHLVDRPFLLMSVFRFLREDLPLQVQITDEESDVDTDLNYGSCLVLMAVIKVFWREILKRDDLCTDLSETLLLTYFFVSHSKLDTPLHGEILDNIAEQVVFLFKHNTNNFIIPTHWNITHRSLGEILQRSGLAESSVKQLDLIKYRNESLMKHRGDTVNRNSDDLLNCVSRLDKLALSNELASCLFPRNAGWRVHLRSVIHWCISPYRSADSSRILTVCNFIKRKVLQQRGAEEFHREFENEVLDIIYTVADSGEPVSKHSLYVLFNELYQLKVITIATYLRKLIASGIFYANPESVPDPRVVDSHLDILRNLPVLNNKQCDSILRRWSPSSFDYANQFEQAKACLSAELVDYVVRDDVESSTPQSNCSRSLNVGLRFLIVNWVTGELKRRISESAKLVHITPLKLAHLYNFYIASDNHTVFFKVVVKFLLRNESGMIIFYMDSLHFIAHLVMMHFKSIKFIAGNCYDSVSTSYELFKLIVFNYKDLASRETSHLDFGKVWRVINGAVERGKSFEAVDSPMRLPQNEQSDSQFRADLDVLLRAPKVQPETTVKEVFDLYASGQELDIPSLVTLKGTVDYENHIKSAITIETPLLEKLIINEVLSVSTALEISPLPVNLHILFGVPFSDDKQILWESIVGSYKTNHPQSFSKIVFSAVKAGIEYEGMLQYLSYVTVTNTRLVMDELIPDLSPDDVILLMNKLLLFDEPKIKSVGDFGKHRINEFNLPFYQILLCVVVKKEPGHLKELVDNILSNLNHDLQYDFYFGELFNYLSWEHRLEVLDILEKVFFNQHEQNHLLPVLNNFFKKFVASSVSVPHSNLLERMTSTLSHLLVVAEQPQCPQSTKYAISVFLRILIIHKTDLIQQILSSDPELSFIKSLVSLLNSHYLVKENEKLHILLYDLLHILKANMTDQVNRAEKESEYTTLSLISSIFGLIETKQKPSLDELEGGNVHCSIMLTEEDLQSGDYDYVNNSGIELVSTKSLNGFGLGAVTSTREFKMQSFEILEDVSRGLNDGCLNLYYFDAFLTKENAA